MYFSSTDVLAWHLQFVLATFSDQASIAIRYDQNIIYTVCANKNSSLEKILYFNHSSMDFSQTFRLYVSNNATCPANCIKKTYIVQQIQQFKL